MEWSEMDNPTLSSHSCTCETRLHAYMYGLPRTVPHTVGSAHNCVACRGAACAMLGYRRQAPVHVDPTMRGTKHIASSSVCLAEVSSDRTLPPPCWETTTNVCLSNRWQGVSSQVAANLRTIKYVQTGARLNAVSGRMRC